MRPFSEFRVTYSAFQEGWGGGWGGICTCFCTHQDADPQIITEKAVSPILVANTIAYIIGVEQAVLNGL
jgi:hypothetical protein